MNRARVKLLITDLKTAEKELLVTGTTERDLELLCELKSCIDDFRTTVWSTIMQPAVTSQQRSRHIQMIRMQRVVEMLRTLNRERSEPNDANKDSLALNELMRLTDAYISRVPVTNRQSCSTD